MKKIMKMTMRTFLEKVLETVEDQEMKEFAEERIAKMDMANASRKKSEKELAKAEENKRLSDSVCALQQRMYDLEDLCNRQQKIIDSRCN